MKIERLLNYFLDQERVQQLEINHIDFRYPKDPEYSHIAKKGFSKIAKESKDYFLGLRKNRILCLDFNRPTTEY